MQSQKTLNHRVALRLTRAVCIGDAIGATSEFLSLDNTRDLYERSKPTGWPFVPIGGGSFGWKPGETTDDGDQTKALYATLREGAFQSFDAMQFVRRLYAWHVRARDVGRLTRRVLSRVPNSNFFSDAARHAWRMNTETAPNGALSRNAPVACAPTLDDAFLWSLKQTIATHYHPLCVLTSAIQTWVIRACANENWPWLNNTWMEQWHRDWTEWVQRAADADASVRQWLADVTRNIGESPVDYLSEAMDEIQEVGFDEIPFNGWSPFAAVIGGSGGGAVLTLRIALWALWAAHADTHDEQATLGIPEWFDQKASGAFALCLPALVGRDADSYCAVAAPMVLASTGGYIPQAMKAVNYR